MGVLLVDVDGRVSPGTCSCCDVTAYKGEVGEASVTQVLPLSGIQRSFSPGTCSC